MQHYLSRQFLEGTFQVKNKQLIFKENKWSNQSEHW